MEVIMNKKKTLVSLVFAGVMICFAGTTFGGIEKVQALLYKEQEKIDTRMASIDWNGLRRELGKDNLKKKHKKSPSSDGFKNVLKLLDKKEFTAQNFAKKSIPYVLIATVLYYLVFAS